MVNRKPVAKHASNTPVRQPAADKAARAKAAPEQAAEARQALGAPAAASPEAIARLQRLVGNRAVQRLLAQRSPGVGPDGGEAPAQVQDEINAARGAGQALDSKVNKQVGQALGANFSHVRVHTDTAADHLNQSLSAKAFTTGADIFFSQGAYEPATTSGQRLLAHELTHVVQQGGGSANKVQTKLTVGPAGDAYEREAEAASDQVMRALAPGAKPEDEELQRAYAPPRAKSITTLTAQPKRLQRLMSSLRLKDVAGPATGAKNMVTAYNAVLTKLDTYNALLQSMTGSQFSDMRAARVYTALDALGTACGLFAAGFALDPRTPHLQALARDAVIERGALDTIAANPGAYEKTALKAAVDKVRVAAMVPVAAAPLAPVPLAPAPLGPAPRPPGPQALMAPPLPKPNKPLPPLPLAKGPVLAPAPSVTTVLPPPPPMPSVALPPITAGSLPPAPKAPGPVAPRANNYPAIPAKVGVKAENIVKATAGYPDFGPTASYVVGGKPLEARIVRETDVELEEAFDAHSNTKGMKLLKIKGKVYLFKPAEGEESMLLGKPLGIMPGAGVRKAGAVSALADVMGIATPKTEVVQYDGQLGSLQEWLTNAKSLAKLTETNKVLAAKVKASQVMKDMDVFDYIIAQVDRHMGNFMIVDSSSGPSVHIIDNDGAMPPTTERFTPAGQSKLDTWDPSVKLSTYQRPLPPTISRAFYNRLLDI